MQKLGIIDSGVGGLSLLKEFINKRIDLEYYYICDSKNVPYGEKSQDFMFKRMSLMTQELLQKEVNAIFLACNTATAETIDRLRSTYSIPFFGIEPYINYLNHTEHKQHLGIILTTATFDSVRFQQLKQELDPNDEVKYFPLKNLALLIEKQVQSGNPNFEQIDEELGFLNQYNLEQLILGCTHYPILKNHIEKKYKLKTIDPHNKVVSYIARKMDAQIHLEKKSAFQFKDLDHSLWQTKVIEGFNLSY